MIDLSFVRESVYMRNLLECQIVSEIIDSGVKELSPEIQKTIRLQKDLVETRAT